MTEARIEQAGPSGEGSPAGDAALRIAVVGPTHPHTGGVAAHTTMLAHHLQDAGHDVVLVSWAHLHPSHSHRVDVVVPRGGAEVPEVPPFPRTIKALSWARPDTWVRVGRRLRDVDAVVVVHATPAVVPAHLVLLRAAGALPGARAGAPAGLDSPGARPQSVVICHTVLPVEPRPGDAALMGRLLSRVDAVLVHSLDQARLARDLGATRVSVADLPPHVPGGERVTRGPRPGPTRLLALGLIREHKGVDVLLRAMRSAPDVTLTIAGEVSGSTRRVVATLTCDPLLAGRVEVREGYVPADALAALLADHDVLALTYRSATASQNVALAHSHGLPVLATDVDPFSQQVLDGVNGLLVPPDDEHALVAALLRLGDPEVRRALADGVHTPDLTGPWAHYLGTIEALSLTDEGYAVAPGPAARTLGVATEPVAGVADAPRSGLARVREQSLRRGAALSGRAYATAGSARHRLHRAIESRRQLVDLRREDVPDWVLPTDVLVDPADSDDARRLARQLGLPRSFDGVASWAALGALTAILRVRDDGRRSAVIVDETGSRSLLSRWARAVGFAPVEIEFTGNHPSVAALDVDTGSLDVIVRIHPRGCDAGDINQVLEQASWALRSGGLLIVTIPIG
ncbi:MAG: glycosyltransferase family 4 protein, partial [Humibacillus sp.]